MPVPTKLGISFTDAEIGTMKAGIQVVIDTIKTKITLNLSVAERETLSKLGAERMPYVEKSIGIFATDYPQFNPLAYTYADVQNDGNTYGQMDQILSKLEEADELSTELQMVAGHFALLFMRKQYDVAKSNVDENVPGAQVIVDGLKGAFEGQGNFGDEPNPNPNPPTP